MKYWFKLEDLQRFLVVIPSKYITSSYMYLMFSESILAHTLAISYESSHKGIAYCRNDSIDYILSKGGIPFKVELE